MTSQWARVRGSSRRRPARRLLGAAALLAVLVLPLSVLAAQNISPTADGTLADGGPFGVFDGIVDTADWSFNESSFEGAITLIRPTELSPGLEQRVVWEYRVPDSFHAPLTATLSLRLRGAPRFPAPPTEVFVYAYPADSVEAISDFSAGPTFLVGAISVAPYQSSTAYVLGVSVAASTILNGGAGAVGFRLQVDSATPNTSNQAFVDAVDSDPATKPTLTIDAAVPGDSDGDSDVDALDVELFVECIHGPDSSTPSACRKFDFDLNGHVDLRDFVAFEYFHGFFGQ